MTKANIKSIVVGVDFSLASKQAVARARGLAKLWKLPLTFAHVFEDPFVGESYFTDIIKSLKIYHTKRLKKFYKITDAESIEVEVGSPVDKILKIARKQKSPLIVVSFRGQNNAVARFFIGSTAEKLMLNSPFPVFVQRGGQMKFPYKILIPTDLNDRAAETYKELKNLGFGKSKIDVFHVVTPPTPYFDYQGWQEMNRELVKENKMALKKFKDKNKTLKVIEAEGFVVDEVDSRAKKYELLAISPKIQQGFFRGFGSINAKILRSSPISLVVIP